MKNAEGFKFVKNQKPSFSRGKDSVVSGDNQGSS
jgi:hypothetical protein